MCWCEEGNGTLCRLSFSKGILEAWASRMRQKASEGLSSLWRSHDSYYSTIDKIVDEETRDYVEQERPGKKSE